MSIVYSCLAPHGGHLLIGKNEPTPVPKSRAAMERIRRDLRAARPETIVVITPHGVTIPGRVSIGVAPRAQGQLDGVSIDAATDVDLAASWSYHGAARNVRLHRS